MKSNYAVVIQPENIRQVLSNNEMGQLYSVLDKLLLNNIKLEIKYIRHQFNATDILSDKSLENESIKKLPEGLKEI